MKEKLAMSQCEKTEDQAEQNKSHAVAGIEAHPTTPHSCFICNDRCNLAHADLQCWITRREQWPPERIEEVADSERKANARTKNHENLCDQDALPYFAGLTPRLSRRAPEEVAGRLNRVLERRIADPAQFCNDFSICSRRSTFEILCRIVLLTKYKARHAPRNSPFTVLTDGWR
jgi:hypothetical protein